MAILSSSSGNWMLSLKVLLISTGVLSMAVILKLSVPVILEFAISEVPLIWSFVLSWLRPPYLYLVINCIIITIVASSKLQHKVDEEPAVPVKIQGDVPTDYAVKAVYDDVVSKNPVEVRPEFGYGYDANAVKVSDFEVYGNGEARVSDVKDVSVVSNDGDDFAISRSSWTPQRKDSSEYSFSSEKPLVSMRFGHRKAVKASPEAGKALGVSKPRRHDTLETTWKTITDGRPMPLTRHLRKSDTWETHGRHSNVGPQVHQSPPQMMKKSETFNDRSSRNDNNSSLTPSPGSGKLRKEPSLSQDDLNRRVEAFIKKFNEEMRLQRQESLNQYNEMIGRGVH